MIAKLIVWGRNRPEALQRLRRAIDEYHIAGVPTTLPLLRALADFGPVIDASYGTQTLEPFAATLAPPAAEDVPATNGAARVPDETIRVEVNDRLFRVRFVDLPDVARGGLAAAPRRVTKGGANHRRSAIPQGDDVVAPMHGVVVELPHAVGEEVAAGDVVAVIEAMKMMNEIRAHKPGTVTAIHAEVGATVEARSALVTVK